MMATQSCRSTTGVKPARIVREYRPPLSIGGPTRADVAPEQPRVVLGRGETTMPPLFVIRPSKCPRQGLSRAEGKLRRP
jgi:hypothetical protein